MLRTILSSKSQRIADAIKRAIDIGEYSPGVRLPTVRKLGEHYGASLAVIHNALDILEREGKILRQPRSGVLVNPRLAERSGEKNGVLLCMPTSGHLFDAIFTQIVDLLGDAGELAVTVSHRHFMREEVNPGLRRQVRHMLDAEVKGVMVAGRDYWKNPFLRHVPPGDVVFLFEVDYPEITGHGVLLDYDAATYALTRHLIERGRRRIAFAVPFQALRSDGRMIHFEQLKTGYERALREAGLAAVRRYLPELDDFGDSGLSAASRASLEGILRGAEAPDAILCYMDRQAHVLRDAAERLGVRVPDDLALTGFFGTPWANHEGRTLTTVGFDWDFLARRAVELARTRDRELHIEYLLPRLVVGASTGG